MAARLSKLCLLIPLIALSFASCAARPVVTDYARQSSYAINPPPDSRLSRALKLSIKKRAPHSGLRLIATGTDAFFTRIAALQSADRTLDLQYYIVEDDLTGRILLEEIMRAAERGVRVRILIDNVRLEDADDALAVLNTHPGIEIRSFNPAVTKDQPFWMGTVAWIVDLDRVSKRMHNKTLIVDNILAVTGGRNLGDEYFDASSDFIFSDMDVLVTGPVVSRISQSFDRYWNSEHAFPLHALDTPPSNKEIGRLRQEMKAHWQEVADSERGNAIREPRFLKQLVSAKYLIWAPVELSVDRPEKVEQEPESAESRPIERLDRLLDKATKEFIAVTPYFVPREEGVTWFRDMVKRGLRVRVLTNSLASTDVPAVHTGYRRYREDIVKAGVELYEFKPIPGMRTRQNFSASRSRASLHSKVYVVDRKEVVIGSFNLDPRSIELNTELALVIHSPVLAEDVTRMFEEITDPRVSYRVFLQENDLVWESVEKNEKKYYTSDPDAGFKRWISTRLFALLPFEDQL